MQKHNIGFWQALEKVNEDFQLRLGTYDPVPAIKAKETRELKRIKQDRPTFTWTEREFSQDDLKYWSSQGVTKKQLNKYHVKCIEKVYLNNELMALSTKKNPIYGYYYPDTEHIKFYRPLSPSRKDKWFGDATAEDVNGYEQLPYFGDLLIITKSLKDVMTLDNLGYIAIAPQGESNRIEDSSKIRSVLDFFDRTVILYDNDKAGRENSKRLSEALKISSVEIPENYKTKDISETINKWKKNRTKKLLRSLLIK